MNTLITGGCGFIGSNLAARLLSRGEEVVILDNLSRRGAVQNLAWLERCGRFVFRHVDVCDEAGTAAVFREHSDIDRIVHLAGQVAVTTSIVNPRADFEANALGTVNVLEAMRQHAPGAALLYASTNKVYGGLEHLEVVADGARYRYAHSPAGVSEDEPLDFHSPYGCSKGAADQYVRDYHRIYGLRTVVLRQSCIYGNRQFGIEDQGWVAWFAIAALRGLPMRIYGDGRQVRDVLFIDDLLDAYDAAFAGIGRAAGRIYNVGGGTANAVSIRDLVGHLQSRTSSCFDVSYHDWRPGDQRVYISDIRRIAEELGWRPSTSWRQGVDRLCRWVAENGGLFA
jgi:CDP-paratose 2-epimerase